MWRCIRSFLPGVLSGLYLSEVQGWSLPLPEIYERCLQVQQLAGQLEMALAHFIVSHGKGLESCPFLMDSTLLEMSSLPSRSWRN